MSPYQIEMSPYKRHTRRYLALKLRDVYGISAVDIVVVKSLTDCLLNTTKLKKILSKTGRLTEERSSTIKKLQLMIVHRIHHQLRVDRAIPLQEDRARRDTYKFTDFINYNFSGLFRFRSPEDLQRLYEGLQLPGRTKLRTYKTTGQVGVL
jgi:hypothetical protein